MSLNKNKDSDENIEIIDVEIISDNSTSSNENSNPYEQSARPMSNYEQGFNGNRNSSQNQRQFFYQTIISNLRNRNPFKVTNIFTLILFIPLFLFFLVVGLFFFSLGFILFLPKMILLILKSRYNRRRR